MAVENKFKLNIIAASVLMGLSLSVVASAQAAGSVSAAETTPVKPEVKTLAGLTAPLSDEDYGKIKVAVSGLPEENTLADVLNKTKNGSVAKSKDEYLKAQDAYSKLTETQKEIISKYKEADAKQKAAQKTWDEFNNKLSASDSVYKDNLGSLYGDKKERFEIDSGGLVPVDAADNSSYGVLKADYESLKKAVEDLNKAIVGQGGNTALAVFAKSGSTAEEGAAKAAKEAEAKVIAYSNYINKTIELNTTQAKLDYVRNQVIEKVSSVLHEADLSENENVKGKLDAFRNAYAAWAKAEPTGRYAAENALAKAFEKLPDVGSSDELKNLAAVWVKLTGDEGVDGSVAKAKEAQTIAMDFGKKDTELGSAMAAIKAANAQWGNNLLNSVTELKGVKDPADLANALGELKNAYRFLLDTGTGATPAELKGLQNLIAAATDANEKLKTSKKTYLADIQKANDAGAARLNLLLNELPGLQKGFSEAQENYQAALRAYKADGSAQKAQNDLYGADGKSGALGDYLTKLQTTSNGIQNALDKAGKDYADVVSGEGKTQQEKNKALYKLISTQKTLVPVKLQMDTDRLNLLQTAPADAINGLTALKNDLSTAAANKDKAKADYIVAVKDYLAADKAYQTSKSETNAATLAQAKAHLMTVVGTDDISKLYKTGDKPENGFKQFDELTPTENNVIGKYNAAVAALDKKEDGGSDIQKARAEVVKSMKTIAGLMPLSSTKEQNSFRTAYNNALKEVSVKSTTADEQSKAKDAGKVTHILGSLSDKEIAEFDVNSGNYKSIIVNVDKEGNITGVKDNFTGEDLYTGSKDKPFTTTVLDIRALELGNGDKLSDTNTITVGEAGTKDKKATPVEVWAKTAGAKWDKGANDGQGAYDKSGNGPAVKLSGELRTATAALDENGKPVDGQIVRGADQIHLQNVNIHNSFTLDDKVKMLADDVAALNQQAADKLALGQPAEGKDGVNQRLKDQNDLLNGKYDNLQLTGLQIDTKTVNPGFNLTDNDDNHIGEFVNTAATVAPTDANILLDNMNITLQNDSVGGTSTAIDLSGTGNHILAKGGVFDAGKADNLKQANVLDITGEHNLIEFNGSVLKGDIRSDNAKKSGTLLDNTVNLTDGSLTGNAIAGTGNLRLNLDHSVWTGGAGPNSPDISLSNNSVWNVKDFGSDHSDDVKNGQASVSSLSLYGSNSINLVDAGGLAQLGGHGFAGEKSAVTLKVDHDLTSDGKGVTSVLAGTYSPDNLHSLTNTGRADGYQFGTLKVDGLATGGKYALSVESAGAEPYTVGGRLADGPGATSAHEFVSYKTAESRPDDTNSSVLKSKPSTADFTSLSAPAELGVYQYAAEKVMDGVNNRTNIYYSSTGKLSNSAATVVSLAAAPVDVANLQSDTLAKHMNSVRHGKDSGVWLSYFGGENRNTTAAGPEYTLKTNGVMLGADTLTENDWLAGVAVSSARSDMSVMNSSGDLNSYGAQFYMSRRYDSGVFVDSALQFNHFSNTAKARMINGQQAKADFSGNSYGLEAKVGYAWNSEGFFAEPYVRAAARAFDGEHYALSNGMTVNSNDYKSMLGEVGTDLGYQYAISGGYVKPYLHLAALNEFADGNSVRVNNVSLDNSVKGAAFQAGLGAEVKVTDNLGGYAAFDYTKGDNTERPWQATVGVNYTW